MNANAKPKLEALESREVPTVFGNPWQQAHSLTMSFAPDGVSYSNQTWGTTPFTSRLFTELGNMGTSAWQDAILRAVHAWTSQANINVGLVADHGRAFGPAGFSTTGTQPATFRVGAITNGADVIATSIPNHPLAGELAGTMMLNELYTFSQGGANGTKDLFSVALNEVGNLLGLADNDADPTSARYGHYSVRTGLNAGDVSAVQAMYGARQADSFEGANGNNSLATASTLAHTNDPNNSGKTRVVANGDITTAADADFYQFTTPTGTTSFTVRLGTAGKSLLAGRVEVYNSSGSLIGSVSRTNVTAADAFVTISGVTPNTTYRVKVSSALTDTFNTGKYQLRVGFNYDPTVETVTDLVQRFGADNGANNTRPNATVLTSTTGYTTNSHYEWAGQIESVSDHDYYRITAPSNGGPMTITVRSDGGLSTSATVYDAAGNVVAANVLINWEGGTYSAQVPTTTAGATYFLQLKVQDAAYSASSGNYLASVDFAQPLATSTTLTSGTANQSSLITLGIDVGESGTFRFKFTGTSTNTAAVSWADVYIYDAAGNVVAMWGTDGITSSDTLAVFLKKGQYTVQIVPYYNSSSSATLAYDLKVKRLSDPIDPYAPPDPTSPPPPPPPPPAGDDTGIVIIAPPFNPWMP